MTFVTIADYEQFIYGLSDTFPSILASTLRVVRSGPAAGQVIGRLTFAHDIRLEIAELVDLDAGRLEILHYGYVAWQGDERLYWYDSQAHPNNPDLALNHPHHKHIPPDIKHNRIPAPNLSFDEPNLPFLIREVAGLAAD
ncbi:MAG: hypothetical protein KBG20_09715 [Caldilineaceae bacterium]|nr:hypothetical protein [Caldilineaceae bacterium]MBP8110446.1 hypothetical protein [Caldilineaceae bacterium]MBP8122111.1 hypothetical protein [Caldilineaceae bacterium]MBP9072566.1 hypothetical protein [Caldilineaceae bacterium]